jgi:hypothetical protein
LTYTVAASNAPDAIKASANYLCDGVADDVQIQAAITALSTLGGVVSLSPGTFYCSSPITIDAQSVMLMGQGASTTILQFTFASPDYCLKIGSVSLTNNCTFKDFKILGDGVNTTRGVQVGASTTHLSFYSIRIDGVTHTSFRAESGSSQMYAEFVIATNPATYGFHIFAIASTFINCYALGGNTAYGFRLVGSGTVLINCIADKVMNGFDIAAYAEGCVLIAPYAEECEIGINISASAPYQSKGLKITGGIVAECNHATNPAVYVGRSDGTTIVGLYIKSALSNIGISVAATATQCRIINCYIATTTKYVIAAGADVSIESTDALVTFAADDSSPSVLAQHFFKTANVNPTTITMFDNGYIGQEIKVIIDDANTTIDFTGTNLKGNAGVDWSPSSGDFLTAVFDGTSWFCTCIDATA